MDGENLSVGSALRRRGGEIYIELPSDSELWSENNENIIFEKWSDYKNGKYGEKIKIVSFKQIIFILIDSI